MSNYPPTPSYGGPGSFDYHGQFAPPPQPNPHHMAHHPTYHQSRDTAYGIQAPPIPQPQPTPIPISHTIPYSNAYNYSLNTQIPTPNVSSGGIYPIPNSSFPGFGHYQNGALPPPPYPPVPIPTYNNMPQYLSTSVPQVQSPSTLQPHLSLPPKPSQLPTHAISFDKENTHPVTVASTDREDGELSDSELRREFDATNTSDLSSVTKGKDVKRQHGDDVSRMGGSRKDSAQPSLLNTRHNSAQYAHTLSELQEDTILKINGSARPSKGDSIFEGRRSNSDLQHNRLVDTDLPDHKTGPTHPLTSLHLPLTNREDTDGSTGRQAYAAQPLYQKSELNKVMDQQHDTVHAEDENTRHQVKEALRDLYDCKIGFEQLRAEVDASILKNLYLEMGIMISMQSPSKESDPLVDANNIPHSQKQPQVKPRLEKINSQNNTVDHYTSSMASEATHGISMPVDSMRPTGSSQSIHEGKSAMEAGTPNEGQGVVKASDNPEPLNIPKISTQVVPKKINTGDKALERKDYIAKMLAAKSSKAPGTAKLSKPSEIATVSMASKGAKEVSKSDFSAPTGTPLVAPQSELAEKEIDLENKRKAQTELARRKMEALKSRSSTRRAERSISTEILPPLPLLPMAASDSPPIYPSVEVEQPFRSKTPPLLLQLEANPTTILKQNSPPQYIPSSSFFSSLGRRPPSGIPGLFMSTPTGPLTSPATAPAPDAVITLPVIPAALSSPTHSETPASQKEDPVKSTTSQTLTTSSGPLSIANIHPVNPAISSPNHPANIDLHRSSAAPEDTATLAEPSVHSATELSRKRPKAVDFIDPPSTRVKRHLGSSQHPDVFIELSEDEDELNKDKMDIDDKLENLAPQKIQLDVVANAKATAIRDLPPLSDYSSRARPNTTPSLITPPIVQSSSKVKEQQSLKLKEEQILVMQRKIAEMEQRRKAKQATIRLDSSGINSVAQTETIVIPIPKSSSSQDDIPVGVNAGQSHEIPDHQSKAQRSAPSPAESNTLNSRETEQEATASNLLNSDATSPIISRASDEQSSKPDVLSESQKLPEDTPGTKLSEVPFEGDGLEHGKVLKAMSLIETQRQQQRREDLESALSQADAQMEKTASRLKDLKIIVQELETEIQRGLEDRQSIIKELGILRETQSPIVANGDQSLLAAQRAPEEQNSTILENRCNVGEDTEPKSNGVHVYPHTNSTISGTGHPSDQIPVLRQISTQRSENLEDVMDISSSSSDEGEITDASHRILVDPDADRRVSVDRQILAEFDNSLEDYEPELDNEITLTRESETTSSNYSEDNQSGDSLLPKSKQFVPSNDISTGLTEQVSRNHRQSPPDIPEVQNQETNPAFPDSGIDSDDYEPPEPISPVDNRAESTTSGVFDPKPPTPLDRNTPQQRASSVSSPRPAKSLSPSVEPNESNPEVDIKDSDIDKDLTKTYPPSQSHFTTYESPLSIFTSYRYHPKFISEVPNGFRSLTYSHKINPDEPVCRWELAGGVCNDNSCDGQHFRDMAMSDDMILVQMSSAQEGSTQEDKDAYIAGLKKIIQDMRVKKVKDFNTVASEIAAYRARFRGDSSKILPL